MMAWSVIAVSVLISVASVRLIAWRYVNYVSRGAQHFIFVNDRHQKKVHFHIFAIRLLLLHKSLLLWMRRWRQPNI